MCRYGLLPLLLCTVLRVCVPSLGWFPQLIGILWSTTSASAVLTMAMPSKAAMLERPLRPRIRRTLPCMAWPEAIVLGAAFGCKRVLKPVASPWTSAHPIHPLFILYFFFASMHTGV